MLGLKLNHVSKRGPWQLEYNRSKQCGVMKRHGNLIYVTIEFEQMRLNVRFEISTNGDHLTSSTRSFDSMDAAAAKKIFSQSISRRCQGIHFLNERVRTGECGMGSSCIRVGASSFMALYVTRWCENRFPASRAGCADQQGQVHLGHWAMTRAAWFWGP